MIIEDEQALIKIISKRLKEKGYSVDSCDNGEDGRYYIEMTQYDCIILDLMLPNVDGLTLLKEMRQKGNMTPVLILTAKTVIEDRVAGLDSGADDYLTKPFSFDELLARIRVLLRRQGDSRGSELTFAGLTMDVAGHVVKRDNKIIELTSKEYALLEYFMRNKGMALSRMQIAEHVWNYDFDCSSNIVDVYIRYLRSKIDDGFENKLLHTIRGAGYVLRDKE